MLDFGKSTTARLLSVAAFFGLIQAAVESVVLAALYRDILLAPYRFFTVASWDAFTRLYFALDDRVEILPDLLSRFAARGFAAKLALAPELAAIGIPVAMLTALVVAPFARWLGLSGERDAFVSRAIVVLTLAQVLVHAAFLAAAVKIPMDPTAVKVAMNFARYFVHDGTATALIVCLLSAVATAAVARAPVGSRTVAVAVAALLVAGGAAGRAQRPAGPASDRSAAVAAAVAEGYNVILVSVDSLRADRLGAYGHDRPTSPAMDRLAARGVLFEHCSSTTSWTLPSHMSMLTGRSLLGHGVVGDDRSLGASVPTMAEAFRAGGYATGAVVSAPYVNSRYGFDRGFDRYDDTTIAFETNEDSYKSVTAPLLVETAEKWLDGQRDTKFFLFLHFWDVHYDYAPGPPYDTMFDPDYDGPITGDDFYFNPDVHAGMDPRDVEHLLALYDGEVRLVDDHLARLFAHLERLGIADRTIVAVTADHGDEFFEHGRKGHHRTLYEEVLSVPCIVSIPGVEPARRRIDGHASIIDWMPTLLELVGLPAPDGVEGRSLARAIVSGEDTRELAAYGELYRKGSLNVQVSRAAGGGKLIHHFNQRIVEAYDLAGDPAEAADLGTASDRSRSLVDGLEPWINARWRGFRRAEREHGIEHVEIDARTAETLKALGYME